MTPEEEAAREEHPTCTCGYWANPIHARQIAVLGVRLARAEAIVHAAIALRAQLNATWDVSQCEAVFSTLESAIDAR